MKRVILYLTVLGIAGLTILALDLIDRASRVDDENTKPVSGINYTNREVQEYIAQKRRELRGDDEMPSSTGTPGMNSQKPFSVSPLGSNKSFFTVPQYHYRIIAN